MFNLKYGSYTTIGGENYQLCFRDGQSVIVNWYFFGYDGVHEGKMFSGTYEQCMAWLERAWEDSTEASLF